MAIHEYGVKVVSHALLCVRFGDRASSMSAIAWPANRARSPRQASTTGGGEGRPSQPCCCRLLRRRMGPRPSRQRKGRYQRAMHAAESRRRMTARGRRGTAAVQRQSPHREGPSRMRAQTRQSAPHRRQREYPPSRTLAGRWHGQWLGGRPRGRPGARGATRRRGSAAVDAGQGLREEERGKGARECEATASCAMHCTLPGAVQARKHTVGVARRARPGSMEHDVGWGA